MITTRISVDFALPNMGACVEAMQGDGATRTVAVTLRANGLRWEPPAGVDAALAYRQPDGHKGIYDKLADDTAAITVSGNVASVVLIPQMLTVPGDVQCQLIFNDSKLDRLTSFPFVLKVSRNEIAGAAPVQDYIRLQWMEDKLDELLRKAADSGVFRGEKGEPGQQGPKGEPGVSTTVNGKAPDETGNVTLTAGDVGALPSTGGDMTGAINMNGQPVSGLTPPTEDTQAANKGYVDGAVRKAAPRNLLDNSDFRNPVNQRGINSAPHFSYILDRWIFVNESFSGNVLVSTDENGITVTNDDGSKTSCILQRFIDKNYRDGKYTFAVKTTENILFGYTEAVDADKNLYHAVIWFPAGTTVVWAALYEGEYTAETLPEYQPKGYGAELAECQRYYMQFAAGSQYLGYTSSETSGIVDLYIPNTFRATPSISITDINWLRVDGTHYSKPTATINVSFMRTGLIGLSIINLSITVPNMTSFMIALGSFSLSADL